MNNGNLTGLFFPCTAHNTEEYKKTLKKRRNLLSLYLLLFVCSFVELEALTVLYLLIAEFFLSYLFFRKHYEMIL